jgi:hypothetical protein
MKILYTDIDYVLSLSSEPNKKNTKWGWVSPFNIKAVRIYNDILFKTGAEIVISSDWKLHWTLKELQEIFIEFAKIDKAPISVTPSSWGHMFTSLQQLEECRAYEILKHVEEFKPTSWVAIDDLKLTPFLLDENFVYLPRSNEGIKQSSKKDEIIKKLNINDKL